MEDEIERIREQVRREAMSVHIPASQVPNERDQIVHNNGTMEYLENHYRGTLKDRDTFVETNALLIQLATFSQLWWVSAQMIELWLAAAQTMPNHTLVKEEVPTTYGLAFTERAVEIDDGYVLRCSSATQWAADDNGVYISEWLKRPLGEGTSYRWMMGLCSHWEYNMPFIDPDVDLETRVRMELITRRLASLWALASQKNIVDESELPLDRAQRRRAQRSGTDTRPVRIVDLRRPKRSGSDSDEHSTVEHDHRWMVSGHWREQPYGPGKTLRRPTWIAPHIKGPEDKPLVLKETVHVLR